MDLPPASLWRAKSHTGSAQTGSHTSPAMPAWRKLAPSSRKKITRPSRRASSGVILCEKELLRKGRSQIVIQPELSPPPLHRKPNSAPVEPVGQAIIQYLELSRWYPG